MPNPPTVAEAVYPSLLPTVPEARLGLEQCVKLAIRQRFYSAIVDNAITILINAVRLSERERRGP